GACAQMDASGATDLPWSSRPPAGARLIRIVVRVITVAQRQVLRSRHVSTVVLLALLVGLFIGAIGMCGVAAPHGLLTAVRFVLTPRGLYLLAAVRVVFGVILVLVAPSSRAPRVLRLLGFILLVAGLTPPFFA